MLTDLIRSSVCAIGTFCYETDLALFRRLIIIVSIIVLEVHQPSVFKLPLCQQRVCSWNYDMLALDLRRAIWRPLIVDRVHLCGCIFGINMLLKTTTEIFLIDSMKDSARCDAFDMAHSVHHIVWETQMKFNCLLFHASNASVRVYCLLSGLRLQESYKS